MNGCSDMHGSEHECRALVITARSQENGSLTVGGILPSELSAPDERWKRTLKNIKKKNHI